MENAILHDFEMSFKYALFIFYFIGTLKTSIRRQSMKSKANERPINVEVLARCRDRHKYFKYDRLIFLNLFIN